MNRSWFRSRLDRDPRRWVLCLAALEGLGGYALSATTRGPFFDSGAKTLAAIGVGLFAPLFGIAAMYVAGRLVWWTGKLLGGSARPRDLHAALAWSQVPFVIATVPLVIAFPVRVAFSPANEAPAHAVELMSTWLPPLELAAGVAAVGALALHVSFVGVAQGFGAGRALVNLLLGTLAALGLGLAGLAAAFGLNPEPVGANHLWTGLATMALLSVLAEAGAWASSRRAGVSVAGG